MVCMKGIVASCNTKSGNPTASLERGRSGGGVSSRKRKGQPICFSVMLTTYEAKVLVGGLDLVVRVVKTLGC
jgi:hypothetical protein